MIGLIDCNAFYVSCERVFRPDLATKPVGVLSNNDGCIIARSPEIKALGIPMGAPLHTFKDLVSKHGIHLFSGNFPLYGDFSRRTMELIQAEVPEMEVYSIDEAFVRFPDDCDTVAISHRIRRTILQGIGIPVSIGIAPTKTLAKLANSIAKKSASGVHLLPTSKDWIPALHTTSTQDIWGIGSKTSQKLFVHSLRSAYDLAFAPDELIRSVGTVMALRTAYELRGIACFPLAEHPETRKGVTSSRSFGQPVQSISELQEALALYVSRACRKLRADHLEATMISVAIRTNPFSSTSPQYAQRACMTIHPASAHTSDLIKRAHQLLESIYQPGYEYKKASVSLVGLVPAGRPQTTLLVSEDEGEQYQRHQTLHSAIDSINQRFGKETIRLAATGINRPWYSQSSHVSPSYTTDWKDIAVIKK